MAGKDITLDNPKIDRLIDQIEAGEIKIPPLQRPFVWKIEQVIELLESIFNDYPIGSILLWETNVELPSTRTIAGFEIPASRPDFPFYYVLDGQQRLSSLYAIFCKNRKLGKSIEGYEVDTNLFNIFFDVDKRVFIHDNNRVVGHTYISLEGLFDTTTFLDKLKPLNPAQQKAATDLLSKFSNYEVPEVITKKRELEEVGKIFERVNHTGTKLDLFDLMVAITWSDSFHLREKTTTIHKSLSRKGFSGIKDKVILQCMSAIIAKSATTKTITSLKPKDIRDNFAKLKSSLEKAVDYLSTELSVRSVELLPHAHQIVPLCYFFSLITTPSNNQREQINRWFWKTSFSDRYSASTDQRIDEDINEFYKLSRSKNSSVFPKMTYGISEEVLQNTTFSKTNAYSRAFVVLLASLNPKNLANGSAIDTGEALSGFNRKEYHHIFPRAYLEKSGSKKEFVNSLCNFCLLPAASNKDISDTKPSEYFEKIIPKKEYVEILESNLIPIKKEIYSSNNYEKFLTERSKKIVDYIDKIIA